MTMHAIRAEQPRFTTRQALCGIVPRGAIFALSQPRTRHQPRDVGEGAETYKRNAVHRSDGNREGDGHCVSPQHASAAGGLHSIPVALHSGLTRSALPWCLQWPATCACGVSGATGRNARRSGDVPSAFAVVVKALATQWRDSNRLCMGHAAEGKRCHLKEHESTAKVGDAYRFETAIRLLHGCFCSTCRWPYPGTSAPSLQTTASDAPRSSRRLFPPDALGHDLLCQQDQAPVAKVQPNYPLITRPVERMPEGSRTQPSSASISTAITCGAPLASGS